MTTERENEDIAAIRSWLIKEPHLPNDDFGDLMLRKFLHSCYWSLERTKQCIEKFCVSRCFMEEIYKRRDPISPQMKTFFETVYVGAYRTPSNQEILIHQINDPGLQKFSFYDILKSFSLIAETWMKFSDFFADEHIVILDLKDVTIKIISKINVMVLRAHLLYLLEASPIRLKQLHIVNCPPFVDKLYALVKPILPPEVCEMIKFHTGVKELYAFMDKSSLPLDYGGEGTSLAEQNEKWVKITQEHRNLFLNDDLFMADLTKKTKDISSVNVMNGSFRTLIID